MLSAAAVNDAVVRTILLPIQSVCDVPLSENSHQQQSTIDPIGSHRQDGLGASADHPLRKLKPP